MNNETNGGRIMAKAFAGKNARGFHNLPIGTHISICYPYNPITHEIGFSRES